VYDTAILKYKTKGNTSPRGKNGSAFCRLEGLLMWGDEVENKQYDVFISYRRDGGEYLAHNLYERLKDKGYSVFQDIESLRAGNFNTALYDVIETCKDVVLIIPPNGLDRCFNDDDWVRNEISYALKLKKNIIPIMMPGFSWPEKLPDDINEIRNLNGITASTEYFNEFLEKLAGFLVSGKQRKKNKPTKQKFRVFLLIGLYSVGLISPLITSLALHLPFPLWARILYFIWVLLGAFWLWNQIETRPNFAAMCFGTLSEEDMDLSPAQIFSRVTGAFSKDVLISTEKREGFQSYYKLKRLEFGSWDGKRTNYLKLYFKRSLEYYDPSIFYLHSLSRGGQAVKMLTRQGFVIQTTPEGVSPLVDYLIKDDLHVFLSYRKKRLDNVVVYNCADADLKEHFIEE